MIEDKVKKISSQFENLTGIKLQIKIMAKGSTHQPNTLEANEVGVYVFYDIINSKVVCLKVGKAGLKSQARWNSHHYNLDKTTSSSLPKSIIRSQKNLEAYFGKIELTKDNCKDWIKSNLSRIEFKIIDIEIEKVKHTLNLLEALVQYEFSPILEGRATMNIN